MKQLKLAACLLSLIAFGAQAQTLNGIKVEPANAKAGEAVKITATFDQTDSANCGLRIHFGDGQVEKVKINKASEMPYVISHAYAKAGSYKVEAEPTTAGTTLKCGGKRQSAMLTVVAPAPVAAAPAPAAAPAVPGAPAAPAAASAAKAMPAAPISPCPEGWTLVKPGVNAKTKAFSCTAKPGTKIPEPKIACPGDLTYSENSKKGQLACRV
jgi:hypothetical protein